MENSGVPPTCGGLKQAEDFSRPKPLRGNSQEGVGDKSEYLVIENPKGARRRGIFLCAPALPAGRDEGLSSGETMRLQLPGVATKTPPHSEAEAARSLPARPPGRRGLRRRRLLTQGHGAPARRQDLPQQHSPGMGHLALSQQRVREAVARLGRTEVSRDLGVRRERGRYLGGGGQRGQVGELSKVVAG
jgi:hypothetical protein